jgi:predicted alpha/beta superfamily hydrolase
MKKFIVLLIFIVSPLTIVYAQYAGVSIPDSRVRKITSKIVSGQEYELHISLPSGYETSNKKYPVVYLMDSQWDFPLVKSILGEQYYDGFIPEVIMVGVTWGGINPNPDSLRARDYTPSNEVRLKQSGGANKFLDFMKTELFPFIESNYKTDKENRSLMGCSLGGLFTMYTLFTHTDMFTAYVAASPAVGWDNEVLYKYEKTFAKKNLEKPIKLYMTVGDVESGKPTFEKFSNFIIKNKYPNLLVGSKILENTGHSATKPETYSRGLQYIFERNDLILNNDLLGKYVGTYQLATGEKIDIKKEGSQLIFFFSKQNKIALLANTENNFYSKQEFFNVYFKNNNGKTDGFDLVLFGGIQTFIKIK